MRDGFRVVAETDRRDARLIGGGRRRLRRVRELDVTLHQLGRGLERDLLGCLAVLLRDSGGEKRRIKLSLYLRFLRLRDRDARRTLRGALGGGSELKMVLD